MTEEVAVDELRKAVEGLHHCKSTYQSSERIKEEFQGQPVWEGDVHTFALSGHVGANTCYAWSAKVEGSDRRRFLAVLRAGPVKSARDAVRASIVQAYREETKDAH